MTREGEKRVLKNYALNVYMELSVQVCAVHQLKNMILILILFTVTIILREPGIAQSRLQTLEKESDMNMRESLHCLSTCMDSAVVNTFSRLLQPGIRLAQDVIEQSLHNAATASIVTMRYYSEKRSTFHKTNIENETIGNRFIDVTDMIIIIMDPQDISKTDAYNLCGKKSGSAYSTDNLTSYFSNNDIDTSALSYIQTRKHQSHFFITRCSINETNIYIVLTPNDVSHSVENISALTHATEESPILFYWTNKTGVRIKGGPDYKMMKLFQNHTTYKFENILNLQAINYSCISEHIADGTADISFNSFLMGHERSRLGQFTAPLGRSPICVIVRKAPKIPFSLVLFLPFQKRAWSGIIGALIVTAVITYAIHRYSPQYSGMRESITSQGPHFGWDAAVLDVIEVILSGASSRPGRTSPQRLVLASILLFSLILGNAYTGQLLGFLTSAPRYPEPRTLADANRLVRRIYAYTNYGHKFGKHLTPDLNFLQRKLRLESAFNMRSRLWDIVSRGENGYLMSKEQYEIYSQNENLTIDGEAVLYRVPECVLEPGYTAYLMRKNTPHYETVNEFVMRVAQAGLYHHWMHSLRHHMTAHGVLVRNEGSAAKPHPLNLAHLVGPFFMLPLAMGIACVAFALEVLVFRISLSRRDSTIPRKYTFSANKVM